MTLRVGIDLDNTLVCYEQVFKKLVLERGLRLDAGTVRKKDIRDAVRKAAGNDVWTEIQGLAYGPGMKDATLMPGAADYLRWAKGRGAALFVVSHKTRSSAVGGHDLHAAAWAWMRSNGFFSADGPGLEPNGSAFLEETRDAKFARIAALRLTHFIDDLEEFLADPAFPAGVTRLHYAPEGGRSRVEGITSLDSWNAIRQHMNGTV